jgi:LysR family transcriptional regulator, glycine cleavage system transcriptional activator
MAQRPPPTPMLQAFVSAAKTGSFARAAAELNLTASAISHQIAGLEEWWGVQLFERHSRGVKLTVAGQAGAIAGQRWVFQGTRTGTAFAQPQ